MESNNTSCGRGMAVLLHNLRLLCSIAVAAVCSNKTNSLHAKPIASFSANPVQGCNPLKVDFTNTSSGSVRYVWQLGNGNQSTKTNPSAVYNAPGKYSVVLICFDASNGSDTLVLTDFITVFKSPFARFTISRKTICTGDSLHLTDASIPGDGPLTMFTWDYGDGNVSYGSSVQYTYNNSGKFDITYAVQDIHGCISTVKEVRIVEVFAKPGVSISSDDHFRCHAPVDVHLNSNVSGYGPFQYQWFVNSQPVSGSTKAVVSIGDTGSRDVSLRVTDGRGCIVKLNQTAFIKIGKPIAAFDVNRKVICAGEEVQFYNHSWPRYTKFGDSVFWEFGDGTAAGNIQSPVKRYTKPGTYTVSMRFFWDGCESAVTRTDLIVVKPKPYVQIQPRDTVVCRSAKRFFRLSLSGNDYTNVQWGRDNRALLPEDTQQFYFMPTDTNGIYKIKVLVESTVGCGSYADSTTIRIAGPFAGIHLEKSGGCIPYNTFARSISYSDDSIIAYRWNSGELNINSDKKEFPFVNNKFGWSKLMLTVTDSLGCQDRALTILGAGIPVDADFDINKKVICSNEPFTIINNSKQKHKDTVMFLWSWFGNDTLLLSNGKNNIRQFRHPPQKDLRVTFTSSSYGCASKDEVLITVKGPYLDGKVHSFCDRDSLRGQNNSMDYTRTFWRYSNLSEANITDPNLFLNTTLYGTRDLWLFAFNDLAQCADSMEFPLNYDPQDAIFTYEYNCQTQRLSTQNGYTGLYDTFFTWTLTNRNLGTVYRKKAKNLKNLVLQPGDYSLCLEVQNKLFDCTRPYTQTFTVIDPKAVKPRILADPRSCYPIQVELIDSNYSKWQNAWWDIDGDTILPNDSISRRISYSGNKANIKISMYKTDALGCEHQDDFVLPVGGPMARIYAHENHDNCDRPLITFTALNDNKLQGDIDYTYYWDFGYKQSTKAVDTVQLSGPKKLSVTLIIRSSTGCESRAADVFDFKPGRPRAAFKTNSDTIESCPPLNIGLTDLSTGVNAAIRSWNWDFGDNSYSVKQHPSKMYVIPGRYTVTLVVTNNLNCKDTFEIPDLAVVKGPLGKTTPDIRVGCTPLFVGLNTSYTRDVAKLALDMGDGNVLDSTAKSHVYTRPGSYIPRLVLIDSIGCRFSPEPTDTIIVHPTPKAQFKGDNVCMGTPVQISHSSQSEDKIAYTSWFINGLELSHDASFVHSFDTRKLNSVALHIETENHCSDSQTKYFSAYGIKPSISVTKSERCVGEPIQLDENSWSDTTIVTRTLWLNEVQTALKAPYIITTGQLGRLNLKYEITNAVGCKAQLEKPDFLKVGDTTAPEPLTMYYTSVLDNFSSETSFKPSQKPDFKSYSLFVMRNNFWELSASSDKQTDTVLVTTGLNTLKRSYCHIIREQNFCGKVTDSSKVIPHCTIETRAVGDTNMARVYWTPYSGWKEVENYRIWRKRKAETTFSLIDSVPGNLYNYDDTSVWCHVIYDYKIEGVEKGGYHKRSFSDTANASPIHFLKVPAPEVWRTTVNDNAYTHTEWIMPHTLKYPIAGYTVFRHDGKNLEAVRSTRTTSNKWFDDMNTDVANRKYTYTVSATDVCNTTSPESNVGRNIVVAVTGKDEDQNPQLTWSQYVHWNEGVEAYRIERRTNHSAFVEIGRVNGATVQFVDMTIPRNCVRDIEYRIVAVRNQPERFDSSHFAESVSNHVSYTPEIRFYVPNAFTPNNNNLNERYRPDGAYFSKYHMRIYTRWGEKIYDSEECLNSWDGMYNNEISPGGVYTYHILAEDMGGNGYQFSGTFHLIR